MDGEAAFVLANQSSRLQNIKEHLRKTFRHQPLAFINSGAHVHVCERKRKRERERERGREGGVEEGEGKENREESVH